MKAKIQITPNGNSINFYLVINRKWYYLFTQRFSRGVFDFFYRGRLEQEILTFRKWNRNPRLDKTIEKIPIYTAYVRKEMSIA